MFQGTYVYDSLLHFLVLINLFFFWSSFLLGVTKGKEVGECYIKKCQFVSFIYKGVCAISNVLVYISKLQSKRSIRDATESNSCEPFRCA